MFLVILCMADMMNGATDTMHYGQTSVTLLKYDEIGLKIVELGLNLSPFCRRYKNVINLTLPITLVIG